MVQSIEDIARKIQFNSSSSDDNNNDEDTILQIANENIGLAVLTPQHTANSFEEQKITIKEENQNNHEDGKIKFTKDSDRASNRQETRNEIEITLPRNLLKDSESELVNVSLMISKQTVQLVYFKDASLFSTTSTTEKTSNSSVVSGVFSLNVGNAKHVKLTEDLKYSVPLEKNEIVGRETKNEGRYECVFWDFTGNGMTKVTVALFKLRFHDSS